MTNYIKNTVDRVIFACLDFREFVILGLFAMSRIRELSILMIGSTIIRRIVIFARLLNSRILHEWTGLS